MRMRQGKTRRGKAQASEPPTPTPPIRIPLAGGIELPDLRVEVRECAIELLGVTLIPAGFDLADNLSAGEQQNLFLTLIFHRGESQLPLSRLRLFIL
jgi:hypothetical protein